MQPTSRTLPDFRVPSILATGLLALGVEWNNGPAGTDPTDAFNGGQNDTVARCNNLANGSTMVQYTDHSWQM